MREKDASACSELAWSVAVLARRLEPARAARLLNQVLACENVASFRRELAPALAAVAGQLEPTEAARVCADAIRSSSQPLYQRRTEDAGSVDEASVSFLL